MLQFFNRIANRIWYSPPSIHSISQRIPRPNFFRKSSRSSASSRRERRAFAALPRFLIIGPAQSGKSSLIANSGLSFALKRQEGWWFSTNAVFIDVQNSIYADQHEWLTLLKSLKRQRRRNAVDGVLVCIDVSVLLSESLDALDNLRIELRKKINDLHLVFRKAIPVSFIVNKMDYLPGFTAYFTTRDSVNLLGVTLDTQLSSTNCLQHFGEFIETLHAQLLQQALNRSRSSASCNEKIGFFDFANQLHAAMKSTEKFLTAVLLENPYQENVVTAGIYFAASHSNTATVSYFVHGLLSQHILFCTKKSPRKIVSLCAEHATTFATLMLMITVMVFSFFSQANQLNRQISQQRFHLASRVLSAWQHVQQEQAISNLFAMTSQSDLPWYWRIYFLQKGFLLAGYQEVLLDSFTQFLLRPTVADLTHDLHQYQMLDQHHTDEWIGNYYLAFNTLLSLISQNAATANLRHNLFFFISRHLHDHYPFIADPQSLKKLIALYETALATQRVDVIDVDEKLMARAQHDLSHENRAARLYAEIKVSGLHALIAEPLIEGNRRITSDALSNFYQASSWQQFIKPKFYDAIANDDSQKADADNLLAQVKQEYETDCEHQWLIVIDSLSLQAPTNRDEFIRDVAELTDRNSPLKKLAHRVADALAVSEEDQKKSDEIFEKFSLSLKAIQAEVETAIENSDRTTVIHYAQKILNHENVRLVTSVDELNDQLHTIQNKALQHSLLKIYSLPLAAAWKMVARDATTSLNQVWKSRVIDPWNEKLTKKFPFNESPFEVGWSDFSQFFSTFNQFFDVNLSGFFDQKAELTPKQFLDCAPPFNKKFVKELARALRISTHFSSATEASLPFEILFSPNASVATSQIIFDNQTVQYQNGPQEWQHVIWDFSRSQRVQFNISNARNELTLVNDFTGPWAFFHLLKTAHVTHIADHTYRVSWKLAKHQTSIEIQLRCDPSFDLVNSLVIEQLQLPNHVTDASD